MIGIALLALVAVPCLWYLNWRISNTRALVRLQRAAHARHEPLNFQELAASYGALAPESNAYVPLEAVWEAEDPEYWRAFKMGERKLPEPRRRNDPTNILFLDWGRQKLRPGQRLSPGALEATTLFIESQRDHMSQVREALQRPDFRAPIAFDQGIAALLPYLTRMKWEATLFRIEAVLAAEKGHPDAALDSIEELGRLGHCLEKDPFLIGQLVRLSICSMALSSSERLLSQTPLEQGQLRRLDDLIAALQATNGLPRQPALRHRPAAQQVRPGPAPTPIQPLHQFRAEQPRPARPPKLHPHIEQQHPHRIGIRVAQRHPHRRLARPHRAADQALNLVYWIEVEISLRAWIMTMAWTNFFFQGQGVVRRHLLEGVYPKVFWPLPTTAL